MNEEEKKAEEGIFYDEESADEVKSALEKVRKKLKECQEEKQKYLDGWQRTQADFANFKRRNEEQMAEWSKTLGEGLIKDILPVLDSLDAAIASNADDQGLLTLNNQLLTVLKKHGLEEIKSVGEKFNPQFHEVIECEEGKSEHGGEVVSEEIQKGYTLNGKVIRVAKVKVKK
jgi:molecular chaperone GrpE